MRLLAGLAATVAAAFVVDGLAPFWQFVGAQLAILIIVVVGLNFLIGVGGLLSIASAAFVGLGAYTLVIAMTELNLPAIVVLPGAVAMGGLIGWLLGAVSLRLSGFYLAIVTLGFLEVFLIVLQQGGSLTGGGYGLVAPSLTIFGRVVGGPALIIFTVLVSGLACTFTATLTRSRVGRALYALKAHPAAAALQGIDARRMKTAAFAYSSALAALAGALQAPLLGSTHPASFRVDTAVWHLAIVVVGGVQGTVLGAVIAAAILFLLPEVLRPLAEVREYFTGAVLLATLVVAPRGVGGAIHRLSRPTVGLISRLARSLPRSATQPRSG